MAKDRYIVLKVVLRLNKINQPNIKYPDVIKYFKENEIQNPNITQVRQAIIKIRQKKFANPIETGTAGSFFKNLYLSESKYQKLKKKLEKDYSEELVVQLEEIKNKFSVAKDVKIPTAFILDQVLNLKGTQVGGAMVSQTQALAIVNASGQASADDVLSLFKKVRQKVYSQTGLVLENEPQLIGFTQEELKDYFDLR